MNSQKINQKLHNSEYLLQQGINKLDLKIDDNIINKLLIYKDLLIKWNEKINLTALRNDLSITTHHLLDCLAILKFIKGKYILDVGSGAGLPGLIIALCDPTKKITLIDKVGKKASFMRQVCIELDLKNTEIIHARVEDFKRPQFYNMAISRAFSDLKTFIDLTRELLKPSGQWLAMKGKHIIGESLSEEYKQNLIPLDVPFLKAKRCLVQINNKKMEKI